MAHQEVQLTDHKVVVEPMDSKAEQVTGAHQQAVDHSPVAQLDLTVELHRAVPPMGNYHFNS